jgi:predicted nucleotidyltransferase
MRLSEHERATIRRIVEAHFGPGSRVWLFGSRVDDARRGGDIDLYVETPMSEGIVAARLEVLRDLRRSLGDQRYDLVVRSEGTAPTAFQGLVRETGVRV